MLPSNYALCKCISSLCPGQLQFFQKRSKNQKRSKTNKPCSAGETPWSISSANFSSASETRFECFQRECIHCFPCWLLNPQLKLESLILLWVLGFTNPNLKLESFPGIALNQFLVLTFHSRHRATFWLWQLHLGVDLLLGLRPHSRTALKWPLEDKIHNAMIIFFSGSHMRHFSLTRRTST